MAFTVWGAFDAFCKNTVDIEPAKSEAAKTSRGYLVGQLKTLAEREPGFPPLTGQYIPYGSFARRTKTSPLDDLDLLLLLNGTGTRDQPTSTHEPRLKIVEANAPLARFPDSHGFVNSTRVLNAIKAPLGKLPQYRRSEAKKDMNAVRLDLVSYEWSFDIVPAVPIADAAGSILHYLIPDGTGDWLRTDPRIDSRNITAASARNGSNLLAIARLLKYWNQRTHKPRLPSYYFETLILKVFSSQTSDLEIPKAIQTFFSACPIHLGGFCPDPKGLGPGPDAGVDTETKQKVVDAMRTAAQYAARALSYENSGEHEVAIYWWGRVFGPEFPAYGS